MAQAGDRDPLDDLRSYADALVDTAPALDVDSLHLVDGSRVPNRPRRFTVPAIAVMSVAIMILAAEVSVVFVANSAVPGDQFYGIDLLVEDALTSAGLPIDTSSERIQEAEVLLNRNDLGAAIRTARVGYQEMDRAVSGAAIVHLVQAERALALNTDPAVAQGVSATMADLLDATKAADVREVGDVRAITNAALRVERAAKPESGGTP